MRRALPSPVCAEQIRVALLEARPVGLTTQQLIAATGLSLAQVRRGVSYLRDFLAAQHLQPLIWTRGEGYRLDPPVKELIAYEMAQFKMNLHRITRFLAATVDPHFGQTPKEEWIGLVHDQLNGLKAGFKALTLLEPPPEQRPDAARARPSRRRVGS
ncbi:hypothetical protein [Amycolatopsis sp. EV170708-02-1]|uniref:hypothetical protein n=1 Tax=Amycolatopsis sp. EV170708-02-1 TaxID=2919322 RepID=UPI001F0B9D35|nr:hypothetical protein [Amycolatopsis sp. EV170708-02-1]UMP06834.1 hypothetical protein MJQ72_19385 [Amycolatopsis sp. EV170708-02-1]